MFFLYNVLVHIVSIFIKVLSKFVPKLNLFVLGRQQVFSNLKALNTKNKNIIWIHCASLGEFEQGRPIIEALYNDPKNYIVLSFFSPSGYEVRKHYSFAHHICYLPLDTKSNAENFIAVLKPSLVIFIKYEFWPNYLRVLHKNNIRTFLVSGIFRPQHIFFKWYGPWLRKSLDTFEHFFVQNKASKILLNSIHKDCVTISGDTRFDRVYQILKQDNHLEFIETFKTNKQCVVYGSVWRDDLDVIAGYINTSVSEKHIIAPHDIGPGILTDIGKKLPNKKIALFSKKDTLDLSNYDVLVIDTIGLLTKIYSYATIAYVGGGFKTGLHNTLEPAVFGIPIIIGPKYHKFNEAVELVNNKGIISIHNKEEFTITIQKLLENDTFSADTGRICLHYILENKGATQEFLNFLK